MKKYTIILTLCLASIGTLANIRLPNIIANNMVLQRESTVTLWGWADSKEKIEITTSWDSQSYNLVTGALDNWTKTIKTPAAGGPYTITFKGENTIVLENVMIGEVWVSSGQSNMAYGSKLLTEELPNSALANIRLFNIPRTISSYPQDNAPGQWKVCSPEALKGFSAGAYFFGKKLQAKLNVPVAIINSSWGGTTAETWTPVEEVNGNEILKKAAAEQIPYIYSPTTPGSIYNAMIYPFTKFSIGGVIWYQGESNVGTADT